MRLALLAALMLGPLAAPAQTSAQTLAIGSASAPTSVDPLFYNSGPNNALTAHIFDHLVERDARARPIPGLASSWRVLTETSWEFILRPGVAWHDGRPFTAEDVLFSIARAPNVQGSPASFAGFTRAIERIEVPEPLRLIIHPRAPHPLLPLDLSSVSIVQRHAAEGAATEDYNSLRVAIGTGPYRITAFRPGDRAELVRNEAWWGPAQPWARVTYRSLINDGGRTAALLAGDVDIIEQVPSADLPRLRRDARFAISEMASARAMYLGTNLAAETAPGITDNAGNPLPANPLRDVRVRQALSLAIARDSLAERVMDRTAVPTAQWLPEGAFGFDPALPPPRQDIERARQLLAEAGYPDGFRATIGTPNDRWPNDARVSQAIAQMLSRIGIRATVDAMPFSAYAARNARMEFGIRLASWGSSSGESSNFLTNIVATFDRERRTGAANWNRYSSPELDALIARGSATMNDTAREAVWHEATRHVFENMAVIPLLQLNNIWAIRRGLAHEARMGEATLAMSVTPAR